jgi:hypothetical protein
MLEMAPVMTICPDSAGSSPAAIICSRWSHVSVSVRALLPTIEPANDASAVSASLPKSLTIFSLKRLVAYPGRIQVQN